MHIVIRAKVHELNIFRGRNPRGRVDCKVNENENLSIKSGSQPARARGLQEYLIFNRGRGFWSQPARARGLQDRKCPPKRRNEEQLNLRFIAEKESPIIEKEEPKDE